MTVIRRKTMYMYPLAVFTDWNGCCRPESIHRGFNRYSTIYESFPFNFTVPLL